MPGITEEQPIWCGFITFTTQQPRVDSDVGECSHLQHRQQKCWILTWEARVFVLLPICFSVVNISVRLYPQVWEHHYSPRQLTIAFANLTNPLRFVHGTKVNEAWNWAWIFQLSCKNVYVFTECGPQCLYCLLSRRFNCFLRFWKIFSFARKTSTTQRPGLGPSTQKEVHFLRQLLTCTVIHRGSITEGDHSSTDRYPL